jgi:hypothetical protein
MILCSRACQTLRFDVGNPARIILLIHVYVNIILAHLNPRLLSAPTSSYTFNSTAFASLISSLFPHFSLIDIESSSFLRNLPIHIQQFLYTAQFLAVVSEGKLEVIYFYFGTSGVASVGFGFVAGFYYEAFSLLVCAYRIVAAGAKPGGREEYELGYYVVESFDCTG